MRVRYSLATIPQSLWETILQDPTMCSHKRYGKILLTLNLSDFMKKSSIISYTRDALQKVKDDVILFAESEGLGAHANAIRVRFQDGQDK